MSRDATAAPLHLTGAAWATALGAGLVEVWARLLAGQTGDVELPSDIPLRNTRAAVLPPGARTAAGLDGLPAPDGLDAHDGASGQHLTATVATAAAALAQAGLRGADVLLVVGTSLGPHLDEPPEDSLYDWAAEAARRLGSTRPPVALSTACSSGSDALTTAAELITAGWAERCLVGGVDLVTANKRLGHSRLGTMSPTLSRSFDEDRDGMLLGEGCGFVVLESAASATARRAPCLGLLTGWGAANDAKGPTAPDASGAAGARALGHALARAGRRPAEVAVVSTHGTGTRANDEAEAAVLRRVFGASPGGPVAFATKGALGHALGATGVVEALTVALALRHGEVPPVAHLRKPMPDFPLPVPVGGPVPVAGACGVSQTLGFGGFTTCLLLEPAPPASGTGAGTEAAPTVRAPVTVARGRAELDASCGAQRDTRVRAHDPACWAVLDAVDAALDAAGVDGTAPERVGVLVVSEQGTLETLTRFADEARRGRVSPRRFAAAGPGTLAGLSCTAHGFGGPSLVLTMPPETGRPVAQHIARQWLGGALPQADAVALILHQRSREGRHRAECLWLRRDNRPDTGEE